MQGFRSPEEVQRFSDMMEEMCYIVATKHSGSLKGEHGTGRNVAPFVEMEWGTKAYELMWELKQLFDPTYVLNPGVVLNKVSCTVLHCKPPSACFLSILPLLYQPVVHAIGVCMQFGLKTCQLRHTCMVASKTEFHM